MARPGYLVPNHTALQLCYPIIIPYSLSPPPTHNLRSSANLVTACRPLGLTYPPSTLTAAVQVWSTYITSFSPSFSHALSLSRIYTSDIPGFLLMKTVTRQEALCIIPPSTKYLCLVDRQRTWRLQSGSRSAQISRTQQVQQVQHRVVSLSL